MSGTVASQLVGDKPVGTRSLGFQELTKEPLGGLPISSVLQQNVDRVSILVDGSPEVVSFSTDRDEEFIEMPSIPQSIFPFPQSPCVDRPELATPGPNGFIGNGDASFRQEILDLAETETEAMIQPDGVTNDRSWKAMSSVARRVHPAILAAVTLS